MEIGAAHGGLGSVAGRTDRLGRLYRSRMSEATESSSRTVRSFDSARAYGGAALRSLFAFARAGARSVGAFIDAGVQTVEAFDAAHRAGQHAPTEASSTETNPAIGDTGHQDYPVP